MKISHNQPLAKHILHVGQQIIHNGITYSVTGEYQDKFEVFVREKMSKTMK